MAREYFKINISNYDPSKNFFVYRPASLGNPKNNAVMFIMQAYVEKLAHKLKEVDECLVFWPEDFEIPNFVSEKHAVVTSKYPRFSYCRFFQENGITHYPQKEPVELVNGAFISPKAKIGEGAVIMPGAYVSGEVTIGKNAYIGADTKIMGEVTIGDDFIVRENCVIGSLSMTTDRGEDGRVCTMPQFGRVVIGNNVHISSGCVVGRGAIDNTVIGDGARIGPQSLVAHNDRIGENSFLTAGVLLFGSVSLGKSCMISGNATIRNQFTVGDNSVVGLGAAVVKHVPSNTTVKGNPAK